MKQYQTPRGTYDILPSEISKWQTLEDTIRQFCMLYDYKEIRTPLFEATEVFKRENDSSDVVNKEMYTFSINGTDSLTLRPEMTAGVIRSYVQHKLQGKGDLPTKLYYVGPQFRYERPQMGRQRMFHQFGIEAVGIKSAQLDVEVIALGYSMLSALGLKQLKVLVNTLGDSESREAYRNALKEHFKEDVEHMCADCKRRYIQNPLRLLDCKVDYNRESVLSAPKMEAYLNESSLQYFHDVCTALDALQIPYEIDQRLVRGLDYYTHTVFEVVSTSDAMGAQSTIFGGGRYDGLVSYFGGDELPAIGFGMGLERILLALEAEGVSLQQEDHLDVYVVCLSEKASLYAQEIVFSLRANGYSCDRDYALRSFKAQFKSVERKHATYAIVVGEKDVENKSVSIKRIADQHQQLCKIEDLIETMDALESEKKECSCGDDCTCEN